MVVAYEIRSMLDSFSILFLNMVLRESRRVSSKQFTIQIELFIKFTNMYKGYCTNK